VAQGARAGQADPFSGVDFDEFVHSEHRIADARARSNPLPR
jgi:hypothetical protein